MAVQRGAGACSRVGRDRKLTQVALGERGQDVGEDPAAPVSASSCSPTVTVGEGYAVGHLDALGGDYGFRKVRRGLGVTAFGVNALVRPPGYETKWHYHDTQEELYFVHRGAIEMHFGDGSVHGGNDVGEPAASAQFNANAAVAREISGAG